VGFPKAIAGSSITVSTSEVDVATGIKVPDGVGRSGSMVYFSPWIVDTAPSVAEGLGGVFSLAGNWPHSPTEVPSPVGGSHLGAIGARITTPRERWVINQPVSAGQEFDLKFEGFDAVASGARGGATFYYDLSTPSGPPISSKVARETQVSSAGETALADLSLEGAGQIIEFVPKAEVWGDLVSDKETDSVHIDEIIDFLSEEGFARAKKLVKIVLGRLVDTNFLRKIPRRERYYRTKDISFEQRVDWKELVTGCVQNVKEHYPHLQSEYSKMSLHRYTDPFTGKRKDIPMVVKVYGGNTDNET